ncbi:unnamed protein product, partial [Rotaria sordida]
LTNFKQLNSYKYGHNCPLQYENPAEYNEKYSYPYRWSELYHD